MSDPLTVNVDNFVRAESDRMFAAILADAGGVGQWAHNRTPTPLDHQPIIRLNRDTLYSGLVADVSQGATLTLPETGGRYISAMIVSQDHFIDAVFHEAGEYALSAEAFGSDYVMVGIRILVDPSDPADVAEVNALQDQLRVEAASSRPFALPDYDAASLDATRSALLDLARGLAGFAGAFGSRDSVDPVRHLIGTAAGWGGLPQTEALYLNVEPELPVGDYELTVSDVPVDAFWSISVYNAEGYFDAAASGPTSINSVTAAPNGDGSTTVRFGSGSEPNTLAIAEGWNYLVRLYQPRPEVLDGTWEFPPVGPSGR